MRPGDSGDLFQHRLVFTVLPTTAAGAVNLYLRPKEVDFAQL
jgi:hypothetical protein